MAPLAAVLTPLFRTLPLPFVDQNLTDPRLLQMADFH